MTEAEVLAKLRDKYRPPTWAFIEQVRNGTGYMKVPRTADALAMALWPSRGLELIGFEVKVARADWLRELKSPAKAEDFYAFCDRWYVVCPGGVVQPGERPAGWGHMAVGPKGITVTAEAERRKGQDVDRLFLAAILRRMLDVYVPRSGIEAEVERARKEAEEQAKRSLRYDAEQARTLRERVQAFDKVTGAGLEFGFKPPEEVGRLFRFLMDHGAGWVRAQLKAHRRWAEDVARQCADALEKVPDDAGEDFSHHGE